MTCRGLRSNGTHFTTYKQNNTQTTERKEKQPNRFNGKKTPSNTTLFFVNKKKIFSPHFAARFAGTHHTFHFFCRMWAQQKNGVLCTNSFFFFAFLISLMKFFPFVYF
jgi:hypothetical protein